MNRTKIPYVDFTWNPVVGCTKCSEGCHRCYALAISHRFKWPKGIIYKHKRLREPEEFKTPSKIFCCSMSDLFHDEVSDQYIDYVFTIMEKCNWHTFLVLTKRPKRMKYYLLKRWESRRPLQNIWLGVTAENQPRADERIPLLLATPAAKRFVSYEPALGAVDFTCLQHNREYELNAFTGDHGVTRPLKGRSNNILDWIIAGGETGPGARECREEWIQSVYDQCQAAGVPFFFKQGGSKWIHYFKYPANINWLQRREWPK